jgi:hypothetical protein
MDETELWRLIDESRAGNEDDPEAQAERLQELLSGRSSEDLQAFDRLYRERLDRAFTWDLWGAGYLLNGGMSDDSFDYFCDWLVSRGREVFERAVSDPDSLADVPGADEEAEAESLRYAVQHAHESTHGKELPVSGGVGTAGGGEPAGEEWDEDDLEELARRWPRIWARVKDDFA